MIKLHSHVDYLFSYIPICISSILMILNGTNNVAERRCKNLFFSWKSRKCFLHRNDVLPSRECTEQYEQCLTVRQVSLWKCAEGCSVFRCCQLAEHTTQVPRPTEGSAVEREWISFGVWKRRGKLKVNVSFEDGLRIRRLGILRTRFLSWEVVAILPGSFEASSKKISLHFFINQVIISSVNFLCGKDFFFMNWQWTR